MSCPPRRGQDIRWRRRSPECSGAPCCTGTLELRVGHALSVRTTRELRRLLADLKNRARLRLAVSEVVQGWAEHPPEPAELLLPSAEGRTKLTIGRLPSCVEVVAGDELRFGEHVARLAASHR